ncbi:MAG: type II toxin-antitoxin system VapC family toxin [Armatimonadota bacterium]
MSTVKSWTDGITRIGIDTAPIIYFVEAHPIYDTLVTDLFRLVDEGIITGFTSVISLCEVLTRPCRSQNQSLIERYRSLLLESHHFVCLDIDSQTAELAGQLRARYTLKTPDALQIAMAISADCQAFLTNDKNLQRVTEVQVLVIDDLMVAK